MEVVVEVAEEGVEDVDEYWVLTVKYLRMMSPVKITFSIDVFGLLLVKSNATNESYYESYGTCES